MPKEHVQKGTPPAVRRIMNFTGGASTYDFTPLPVPNHIPRVVGSLTPIETPPTLEIVQETADDPRYPSDHEEHSSCSMVAQQTEHEVSDSSHYSREASPSGVVQQPDRPFSALSEAAALVLPSGDNDVRPVSTNTSDNRSHTYDTDATGEWLLQQSKKQKRRTKKRTRPSPGEHDIITHVPPTQNTKTATIPKE